MHTVTKILAIFILALVPTFSFASSLGGELGAYSEDFEASSLTSTRIGSGWRFFNAVFEDDVFLFSYFGLAPNGPQISAFVTDQGGIDQGNVQLSVYSDYECCQNPGSGHQSSTGLGLVETNVFREQTVGSSNVGEHWTFSFDAKLGNIDGDTEALAFLQVLDPNNGFSQTAEVTLDSTLVGNDWARYSISLTIGDWEGQILQFGFQSRAGNFDGAGMFYDNLDFNATAVPIPGALLFMVSGLLGVFARRR
ncbi:MAG: PEP-CTERM sorting domain-containing protein [Gammaproteobacteria bacterium]